MSEDSEKIRIAGAYSITEEAFEKLGDETHMSVFDFVNESIVQEERADSIDQTDQNTNPTDDCTEGEDFYHDFCELVDWFGLNQANNSEGQTKNEESEKEAFESLSRDKSSHEIVSQNDFQNESLQNFAQRKRMISIDHNYCFELENFLCNFCEAENQFDCVCSDSDYDSEEKTKDEKVERDVKEMPKNYVCNFKDCEASYKSKNGLKLHIDSKHLNLKPFSCTECQSTFTQKHALQRHINVQHLNWRPHNCSDCPSVFSSAEKLQNHINAVHLKIKPFKCDQCSYSASSKGRLNEHDNYVHQNLRPHKCSDCGKTFVAKNKLKIHVDAVHLKLKPFKCSTCNVSFARIEDMKKHIKKFHQKPEN